MDKQTSIARVPIIKAFDIVRIDRFVTNDKDGNHVYVGDDVEVFYKKRGINKQYITKIIERNGIAQLEENRTIIRDGIFLSKMIEKLTI